MDSKNKFCVSKNLLFLGLILVFVFGIFTFVNRSAKLKYLLDSKAAVSSTLTLLKLTLTPSPTPIISTNNYKYLCGGKFVCRSPKKYCVIQEKFDPDLKNRVSDGNYNNWWNANSWICASEPLISVGYSKPIDAPIFRFYELDDKLSDKWGNKDAVMVTFSNNLKNLMRLQIKGCTFYPINADLVTTSNSKPYFEKYHNVDTYQKVDYSLDSTLHAGGPLAIEGLYWSEDRNDKEGRKDKILVSTTMVACSKKFSKSTISFRYTIGISPTIKETKEIQITIK